MSDGTPLILLANDDGIAAPGIAALYEQISQIAETVVIAPERNWSASGHSKTMHKPLRLYQAPLLNGKMGWACSGSPSDCVAIALLGALEKRPTMVLSGINQGANVAQDLTYSGTVSAAMEAVIGGVTGIAISLNSYTSTRFDIAAEFAALLVKRLLDEPMDAPLLLNVNVPALEKDEITGIEVTRLGKRIYRDALIKRSDPRGTPYYWIGGEEPDGIIEDKTDIGALAKQRISITPLHLDMTDMDNLTTITNLDLNW